jgi:hypothetical protein
LRLTARRIDLEVVAGEYKLSGIQTSRSSETPFEARIVVLPDLSFSGERRWTDGTQDHNTAAWVGNVCAWIVPQGQKREWALAWREKRWGARGAFDFIGKLSRDGCSVEGSYTWSVRPREVQGHFRVDLEQITEVSPP